MRPPDKSCDDLGRWHRAIKAILQELGGRTPIELVKLLEPDSDNHHLELSHHQRQELFDRYMSDRLGIEFKHTTPTDLYPKFFVQLTIGLYKSHVRLEIHLPRSVAEFIMHEGALHEVSKRKFALSSDESKLFEAECMVNGKDPQAEWNKLVRQALRRRYDDTKLATAQGSLHEAGLYEDELKRIVSEIFPQGDNR